MRNKDKQNIIIEDDTINNIEIKLFETKIYDIRETCLFIYVNGWVCAVDFSDPAKQVNKYKKGDIITIEYEGDLNKDTDSCFNLKILPLK